MSRREHNKLSSQPSTGFVHLMTITRPGTTVFDNIPSEFTTLGLWIVGGGGSGASEHYNSGNSGCGGNGGQARSFEINYTGGILIVDVGSGGPATATGTNKTGANGGDSSVTYNGATYTAKGGLMAPGGNTTGTPSKVDFSGRGGVGWGWNWPGTGYPDPSIVGRYPDGFVGNGENGLPNPFNPNDTNLYGAGGGGGFCSYRNGNSHPNDSFSYGGENGGGRGGGGRNNNATNRGGDATFYGAGGGGGAFSSNHGYGAGGAGYQGIVIIYGKTS